MYCLTVLKAGKCLIKFSVEIGFCSWPRWLLPCCVFTEEREREGRGISFFPLDPSSQIRYCPDDLTQAQFHHHRSQWSRGWVDFGFGVYTVWESTILSGSPLCSYIEEAAAWCSWSLHSCRGAASWSLLLSLAGGQIFVQEETEGHRVTQERRAFLDKQLFLKY